MRRMFTKKQVATSVLGMLSMAFASNAVSAQERTLEQLLETVRPAGAPQGVVAPSSYASPAALRSNPDGLIGHYPDAQKLWGVPMPEPSRMPRDFHPQLWSPNPDASAAYRAVSRNMVADSRSSGMVDALKNVRYPQAAPQKPDAILHDRPMDWQANTPSAAAYFGALQQAKRNAAAPVAEKRTGRAQKHVDYGFELARRGAAHSAHDEFVEALWAVAQANDATAGERGHSIALREALKALREAEDFSPLVRTAESHTDVGRVAAKHKTPVARKVVRQRLDAISAMHVYLDSAQTNITRAIAGDVSGAHALYGMAKSLLARSRGGAGGSGIEGAQSMALLLAAHSTRPEEPKFTNELGVLYAEFGDLTKAEVMLKRSLTSRELSESWRNLSRVWELAGKAELSIYATKRAAQLKAVGATSNPSQVQLVAADVLAATALAADTLTTPTPTLQTELAKADALALSKGGSPETNLSKQKSPNWFQRLFPKSPSKVVRTSTIQTEATTLR